MDYSFDKLRDLDLSRDEVDRIGEALKKKEFRKLLTDYVEELQDPKNKKLYEEEITQLEKERGVDVTFIHPKPGYVIKTSVNGNQKAFINICANDHIKKPSSSPTIKEGAKGLSWSLPHSLSPPRDDIDNKSARCQVFDIVFHSDTLHLAEKNKAFRAMVNHTALEAVEASFDVKLDKKNLKFPKLSYKGMAHASVIRKPSESVPVERSPEEKEIFDKIYANANNKCNSNPTRKHKKSPRKNSVDDKSSYTTPRYFVKHRSHVDIQEFTGHREAKMNAVIPKELIVEINLPLLKSSMDIMLDVTEKTIQLISEKPAKYKLNLTLPYNVNESCGNAKFDKDLKKLVITLPVRRNNNFRLSDCKDDSGVESDHCAPETSESPESEDEIIEELLNSVQEPSEKCLEKSTQFRTKFLDENVHYTLPDFSCHVFENVIAFTLNVKNVDENSVGKLFDNAGSSIHVKFTSIGSSFYPSYYAFCVKFPEHKVDEENTTVEVWDNNVVLQVPMVHCDKQIQLYSYGISEDNLLEKHVEEPEIINQIFEKAEEANQLRKEESEYEKREKEEKNNTLQRRINDKLTFLDIIEGNVSTISSSNSCMEAPYKKADDYPKKRSKAIDILCTSYESSGDELSCSSYSPRKNKGILKRLSSKRFTVGRSISESSLDDFVCSSSSFENCHMSLDSVIPEDGEVSTSLKKTVRFNDVVTRQLFRSNSSILGQKKKNQRKSKNKKRALERRYSESENSEVDDKKEGDINDCRENDDIERKVVEAGKKEDHDIFHLDIDN